MVGGRGGSCLVLILAFVFICNLRGGNVLAGINCPALARGGEGGYSATLKKAPYVVER